MEERGSLGLGGEEEGRGSRQEAGEGAGKAAGWEAVKEEKASEMALAAEAGGRGSGGWWIGGSGGRWNGGRLPSDAARTAAAAAANG
eukprot:2565424-Prymnesium_polylepis.1